MHARSFTFLALMAASFTAFSLPLSESTLYDREDLTVYARDTDQYLFDRFYDGQAARSLEERDSFNEILTRSDLEERFFLTKLLGVAVHGVSAIANKIKQKKQQKAQAKQRQQAQQGAPAPRPQAPPQPKKHKGKREYMDKLVERDFEDIFARDVVEWLYERSPEEHAAIFARLDAFPEYSVRSIEDLD